MSDTTDHFDPPTSPGEVLLMRLETLGWNQSDLASVMGRPVQTINDLVTNQRRISPDLALELQAAVGVSANMWLELELKYLEAQQGTSKTDEIALRRKIREQFPFYRELENRGWIPKFSHAQALLDYLLSKFNYKFQHRPAYKLSPVRQKNKESMDAWHMLVYNAAQNLQQIPDYHGIPEEAIHDLLELSADPENVPQAIEKVRALGIRLVVVPNLNQCPVDGIADWDEQERPYIGLSLRYGKIDTFWFVLLHELSHIMRGHRNTGPDCQEDQYNQNETQEKEANEDASRWLIDPQLLEDFIWNGDFTEAAIKEFAAKINRHEAVVIGRLKFLHYVPWSRFAKSHISIREHLEAYVLCTPV